MGSRDLVLRILGDDVSGSKALGTFAGNAEKADSTLKDVGAGIAKVGAVMTGVGAVFTVAGAKLDDAQRTLRRAIENGGFEYDKYRAKIDKAVDTQAKFGHSSAEVQSVLANLTLKFKDPQKGLDALGLAADIAAAKNISLAEASALVSKAMSGNAKVLKSFGIEVESAKKATEAAEKATTAHAKAQEAQKDATQDLADMQALLADKQKLSLSETISLREATEDLTEARKSGKASDVAEAEERLRDVQARIAEGAKLTTAEQLRLRDAQAAVTEATSALDAATVKLTGAQAHAKEAAGAGAKAIDQLKEKVGGMAKEEAETFRGKMEGVKTALGNVVAELGQRFGPALTAASAVVTVGGTAAAHYTAIAGAAPAIVKAWTAAQAAFNAVMSANPIVLVGIAIAALVAGMIVAYQHSETFRNIVDGAFRAVGAAAGFMRDLALTAIQFLVDKFLAAAEWIVKAAAKAFGWLPGVGDDLRRAARDVEKFRNDVVANLNAIQSKEINVRVRAIWEEVRNVPGFMQRRAHGGPVSAGTPYLVGERGPEVIVPSGSGTVIPNNRLAAASSGTTIVYSPTIQVAGSVVAEQDLGEKMMRQFQEWVRRNGTLGL